VGDGARSRPVARAAREGITQARLFRLTAGPDGTGDAGAPPGRWHQLILAARWARIAPWALAAAPLPWLKMIEAAMRIEAAGAQGSGSDQRQ